MGFFTSFLNSHPTSQTFEFESPLLSLHVRATMIAFLDCGDRPPPLLSKLFHRETSPGPVRISRGLNGAAHHFKMTPPKLSFVFPKALGCG